MATEEPMTPVEYAIAGLKVCNRPFLKEYETFILYTESSHFVPLHHLLFTTQDTICAVAFASSWIRSFAGF